MLNELNAAVIEAMDTYCDGDEENLTVRVTSMAEDGPDLLWWLSIEYKGDCVSRWMLAAEGVRHSSLRTPGYGLPELLEDPATEGGEAVIRRAYQIGIDYDREVREWMGTMKRAINAKTSPDATSSEHMMHDLMFNKKYRED